ncbi:zf-HC2 domain-containing protein [Streptomyces sp. NPDC006193]|uniref:anti-sigma factor family protein n=1 Tax=Streptomyces sp. NPDC006193 TaxID=3155717 RepID=UPI0033AC4981
MTDTAGHPDVAEISDLAEGLLPPDRSTDVRRHLESCDPCADVYASLEEIRGLLRSVEPERMPDDVAARIDAVLAAEEPLLTRAESTTGQVSRETPAPAARPAGRPRAATGPGRKGAQRGRRRGRLVLGAVLTAAVLGAGSLLVTSLGENGDQPTAHGSPTPIAGAFSGDSLQNQVRRLLDTKRGLPPGGEKPGPGTDGASHAPGATEMPNTLIQTSVPVPDCVRQALRPRADVLGAKTGTYAGKPAYLVVVSDTRDSRRVTAYVVDAACVHRQTSSAGSVLVKQSLARP